MGIDWTFAGEAVEYGGFLVRATAVFVSLGGMLVTALMLGIVSGEGSSAPCRHTNGGSDVPTNWILIYHTGW